MEDLEQRAVEVFDHVVVGGEAFIDKVAQVPPDGFAAVPVGDAEVAYRVIGETVEAFSEGLVVDLFSHGQ
jgi:hypothetical protein